MPVVCAASAIAAAEPDIEAHFQRLLAQVDRFRQLRDARIAALPPAEANSYDDGCVELVSRKALYGNDLIVQLIRRDGKWTAGAAHEKRKHPSLLRPPELTPYMCEAEAGELTVGDGGIQGDLTVHLRLWDGDERFEPTGGKPIPCNYRVDIKPTRRRLVGTAQLSNPLMVPLTAEPRVTDGRWIPAGRPRPRPAPTPPKSNSIRSLFEEAAFFVREAHSLYEELRAVRLQQERGIPVEVGLDSVTHWRVLYHEPVMDETGLNKKPRKEAGIPSLDDVDGLDLDDVGDVEESAAALKKRAELARAKAEAVKSMADHVREMLVIAKAATTDEAHPVQVGDADTGDPDFGPFSAVLPLERKGGVSHAVPADVGKQGRQEWRHPDTWDVLGPFPQNLWMSHAAVLPDIVPDTDGLLLAETNRLHGFSLWGRYWGKGKHEWTRIEGDALDGTLKPPAWMINKKYPWAGKDWGALYAVCELETDVDVEPWAAMVMSDGGALWANDRLVWRSGVVPDWSDVNVFRFRLPLRKGKNRIMVRCENTRVPHRFVLRICTVGQPRPKDVAAATATATKTAFDRTEHSLAGTIGFRNDQSGRFPDTSPVLAFDLEKGINVPWRVPLRVNNGAPLAVNDKVFTMVEPMTLVCLKAVDGTILWTRDIDPLELTDPAQYRKTLPLKEEFHQAMLDRDTKKEAEIAKKLNPLYPRELQIVWDGQPWSGNVGSTPITDGKHLWVKAGHHMISCLDLAGNVQWQGLCEPTGGGNHDRLSSPLLVRSGDWPDIVVCQVPRADKSDRLYILKAWNAATGKELWETERYVMGGRGHGLGTDTPHIMRLANGKDTLDVIVTSGGRVFRATDGKVLHPYMGSMTTQATPIDNGRGVVFTAFGRAFVGASAATRLILVDRDTVHAETLWKRDGYSLYGCWVLRDGIAWGFEKNVRSFDFLTALPRGQVDHVFAYSIGHNYAPPALAGDILFIADDERSGHNNMANWHNASFPDKPRKTPLPSCLSAVLPGPDPLVLARNASEGITMGLSFDGDRWFVRSRKRIFCVAATGEEGRRHEAEVVAKTILDQLQLTVPEDTEAMTVPALAQLPSKEYSRTTLRLLLPMTHWTVIGPIASDRENDARAELHFAGHPHLDLLRRGASVEGADTNLVTKGRYADEFIYPPRFALGHARFGVALDLMRVHKGEAGSVAFWSAILHNPYSRIVRLDLDSPHAEFFIGGKRIAHNQRVYLPHGNYVFDMRTVLQDNAPAPVTIRPRLWLSNDVRAEYEHRLARLSQAQPYLERARKLAPESNVIPVAERLLHELAQARHGAKQPNGAGGADNVVR